MKREIKLDTIDDFLKYVWYFVRFGLFCLTAIVFAQILVIAAIGVILWEKDV